MHNTHADSSKLFVLDISCVLGPAVLQETNGMTRYDLRHGLMQLSYATAIV